MAYESHARMTRMLSPKLAKAPAPKPVNPSQAFLDVLQVFDETRQWPSEDDPIHGKAMKSINTYLRRRDNGRTALPGNGLTLDVYEMFKRRNYSLPPKRLKAVGRVLEALSEGLTPARSAVNEVRELHVAGKISKEDIATFQSLKFCL